MYPFFLAIHNLIRWAVLILAILALVRAFMGWFGRREWTAADRKAGVFFGAAVDTQLLLGLILYFFLSPLTRTALQDMGQMMANPELRFFGLEHTFYMVLAVVFVHLGSILPKRVQDGVLKHRRAALWFSLATLVIILGMPWMRPLLRGL